MNWRASSRLLHAVVAAAGILLWLGQPTTAQGPPGIQQAQTDLNRQILGGAGAVSSFQQRMEAEQAEIELRKGTELTSKGLFSEAIPHLLAVRGRVLNEYAASFNLALCYLGVGTFKQALQPLDDLRRAGHDGDEIENLLAQVYLGSGQLTDAFAALTKAAAITPQNDRLYLLVT